MDKALAGRIAEGTAEPSLNGTEGFRLDSVTFSQKPREATEQGVAEGGLGFDETGAELIDSGGPFPPSPPSARRPGLSPGEEKGKSRYAGLLIN